MQRRILYGMSELGLRPDRAHVKSSRVVGEVMGKYHPHGDQAIYDALVRMAQPFTMRLPLVDGHGNFGSLDDGPAASRYTEARMAQAALLMVAGLDEDTVDFVPNYDDSLTQPGVMPAAYPNLLVNGASGIAVGMATNMAPHNLVEVIGAARHLIAHPDCSLDDLMKFVPGPDLPGGGRIVGLEGMRDAYLNGRGSFRTRATARVEKLTPRRNGDRRHRAALPDRPREGDRAGQGRWCSPRSCRASPTSRTSPTASTGCAWSSRSRTASTPMPCSSSSTSSPRWRTPSASTTSPSSTASRAPWGSRSCCAPTSSSASGSCAGAPSYRLRKRKDRLHLVEGLLVAILDIDEVIQLIRASDDTAMAKARLISVFDLSDAQADYILELQLRRLTRFSRLELETERDELLRQIEELEAILDDEKLLHRTVSTELADVAKAHGTPRRTVLLESAGTPASVATPLEVTDDPCWVLLSSTGLLARTSTADPVPSEGGRAKHDAVIGAVRTTARGEFALVTSLGRMVRMSALDLPTLPPLGGSPSLSGGAPLAVYVDLPRASSPSRSCRSTRTGLGSRSAPPRASSSGSPPTTRAGPTGRPWPCATVTRVVGAAALHDGGEDLVFVTSDAQLLRFPASAVRPQGRAAGGMAGIRLAPGATVTFFGAVDPGADNVVVTSAGSSDALPGTQPGALKVTPYAEYPAKGRGTGGVRAHRFLRGEDTLVLAWVGAQPARPSGAQRRAARPAGGDREARRLGHRVPGGHRRSRRAGALTSRGGVLRNRYRLRGRARCAPCVNAFTLVPVPSSPRPTTRLGATSEMEAGNGPQLKAPHCGVDRSRRGGPDCDGLRKQ